MTTPTPDHRPEDAAAGTASPQDDHHEKGNTRVNQAGASVPRLPHERDDSVDSQPDQQQSDSAQSQAAYADAVRGRPDTSKADATDALYARELRNAPD